MTKQKAYWARLSPTERSAEMKRRMTMRKAWSCKKCDKTFTNYHQLGNHVRYAHPKRKVVKPKLEAAADNEEATQITYAAGYVQSWLDTYANSHGLPGPALTRWVGEILQRSSVR